MNDIVQAWLDNYRTAWASNEPDDIRALFTEGATYAGGPFDPEPWVGREVGDERALPARVGAGDDDAQIGRASCRERVYGTV